MGFDDAFHDGKAEPHPSTLGSRCLPKPVEHVRQVRASDPATGVRDRENDLARLHCRPERDAAAGLREFDRIADEVLEHLEEAVAVCR